MITSKSKNPRKVSRLVSISAAQTRQIGRQIGKQLRPGQVVAVSGNLGAGKTTLIQGIVKGLGSPRMASSPTFTLIHEYEGRVRIYHLDWYRLGEVSGTDRALALECLDNSEAVTLIEWPERGKNFLPPDAIRIRLTSPDARRRKISLRGLPV